GSLRKECRRVPMVTVLGVARGQERLVILPFCRMNAGLSYRGTRAAVERHRRRRLRSSRRNELSAKYLEPDVESARPPRDAGQEGFLRALSACIVRNRVGGRASALPGGRAGLRVHAHRSIQGRGEFPLVRVL